MKRLIAVSLCAVSVIWDASGVVIPVNCNLFFNGSNAVQIAWNCYPGESYVIKATTSLPQPWEYRLTKSATLTSIKPTSLTRNTTS